MSREAWVASRLVRWWRRVGSAAYRVARRTKWWFRVPVYRSAARAIQWLYRAHRRQHQPPASPQQRRDAAALRLQRAWRRFTQRRIYKYFRNLVLSRQGRGL